MLRIGRAEQEHALPRDGEADADLVVRDRERGAPVLAAVDDDVHALAEPHRRLRARILEPPHPVDPRPRRVHHRLRAHLDRPAVGQDLDRVDADDFGVVEDGRASIGGGADVRERQPAVVRPCILVERTGAQPAVTERRHQLFCAFRADEAVEPRAGEGRVDDDPASARTTAGRGRPRRAERGTAAAARGAGRRRSSARGARGAPRARARCRRAAGSAARRGSSFDDALEVAPAKSPLSTSATWSPCADAASAIPAPTIPPPITSRSNSTDPSRSRAAKRLLSTTDSSRPGMPCVSDTTTRPYGARGGFSSRQTVMRPAESRSRIVDPFG